MPKWAKASFKVAKDSVKEFFSDNGLNVAAAITYYALQSIIPLILGFIVIGSFFLQGSARTDFVSAVRDSVRIEGFDIGKIIDELSSSAPGLLSVSAIFLLWSGSGIFDQFIFGINVAYDVKKDERSFFVKLGLRLGLLLILGGLIAGSFVVTILFQLLVNANVSVLGLSPKNFSFILPVISILIPLLLVFSAFAVLYKLAPDRKGNKWMYVAVGAAVATVLFELLKYGFTFYVTTFNAADSYQKTYGALGGILLFLLYIWLSSAVVIFGAEVAAVMGGWKSTMEGPASQQDPGVEIEAEKADSDGGPLVTEKEKAQGKDKPVPATQKEGKESAVGHPALAYSSNEANKGSDDGKKNGTTSQPTAIRASTTRYPAQPDRSSPVAIVFGVIALGLAAVIGIVFRRKDPAA